MVKRINDVSAKEAEFLHSPFVPFEVRPGDPIQAKLRLQGTTDWESMRVWRYSPFGIELVRSATCVMVGAAVDLNLQAGDDETSFHGVTVAVAYREGEVPLLGIRLFMRESADYPTADKREKTRWRCADAFLPTGSAANPLKFNDYVFFRVIDMSANGMRLMSSMRNKSLIKGQRLKSILSVPCVGSVQCNFEIVRIDYDNVDGKEFVIFGVRFLNADSYLMSSVAEYLLQFAEGVTVSTLSKDGFPISSAYKTFDFGYVKSEAEYAEVLALRFKAYRDAGKVNSAATVASMADEFDARSRILVVKHRGHIVGSVRIIFHEDADTLSYGRYFDAPPEQLPDRRDYAEASRMCIDPDYQGADIFYHLAEHMVLTTVKSGRRYLVGGSAGKVTKKWDKCGFKKVGVVYQSKDIAGMEHDLILLDTHRVALGADISLRLWNRIFGRMVAYMLENKIVEPTSLDIVRINVIKAIARMKLLD